MLLLGDCIEQMKNLADNSVDAVVTDPPYGLSFMGKKWDYDVPPVDMWRETLRVLKPGGHVLSFGGTRTYHRMVMNMEDAGFDIRDQLQWIFGSGFPKSHNIGKQIEGWDGWGSALKPANEPIVLARKPLSESTLAKNVLKWGVGGLNIDECKIKTEDNLGRKIYQTQSWKNTSTKGVGSINDDWKQGRWPANVMLDEAAAEMLDGQSGVLKSGAINAGGSSGTNFSINGVLGKRPPHPRAVAPSTGGASRFFYVAKTSKREKNAGCEVNNHLTVKPIKLMEYLITLITPPNGIVLDPFMGSGSTGVAAKRLNRKFIGIEMNAEYMEIAKKRIEHAQQESQKCFLKQKC